MSRSRITGTVEQAVEIEEALLGRKLPLSFRQWLLENNAIDLDDIHIFPVRDERDTRKTWESLAYILRNEWSQLLKNFTPKTFSHLLPFATYETSIYFCFDFSKPLDFNEPPVVIWSTETGETEYFAANFSCFVEKVRKDPIKVKQC